MHQLGEIICMHACSIVSKSLRSHELKPPRLHCPWNFSGKQAYWSELLFPTSEDLPDSRTEPASLVYPALGGKFLPLCHLGKITQRKFQPELIYVLSFLKVIDEAQNCVLVSWKLAKASLPHI